MPLFMTAACLSMIDNIMIFSLNLQIDRFLCCNVEGRICILRWLLFSYCAL